MATKIRLQRGGRKNYAFYSIVIADARAPRDGKFTEKIGTYNPNTNPATVDLNFDRALYWVETGAQPTDTARNILKGEGVYMMKHLRGGVKKGAFDEAACQQKFDAWKQAKDAATEAVEKKVTDAKKAAAAHNLEAEKKLTRLLLRRLQTRRLLPLQLRLRLRLKNLLQRLQQRHNPRSLKHKSIGSIGVYGLFVL